MRTAGAVPSLANPAMIRLAALFAIQQVHLAARRKLSLDAVSGRGNVSGKRPGSIDDVIGLDPSVHQTQIIGPGGLIEQYQRTRIDHPLKTAFTSGSQR